MYTDSKKWMLLAIIIPALLAAAAAAVTVFGILPKIADITISLAQGQDVYVEIGETYEEPGAVAVWKSREFKKELPVTITGQVNTNRFGEYTLEYTAEFMGKTAKEYRKVHVVDSEKPVITLTDGEAGYTATDNYDGDITHRVTCTQREDMLIYTVSDTYGNVTTVTCPIPEESQNPEEDPWIPGQPNGKTIYLTFDDGPGKHTPRLLDVLKKYNIHATFFVVKNGNSDTIARIAEEGHTVAAHTASHVYKEIYASEEAYFKDLETVEALILSKTGTNSKIVRFPGGSGNKSSSFNKGVMTRLTQLVEEKGYVYFDWHVDSKDSVGAKTAQEVYDNVTEGIANCKSDSIIVLQHDIKIYSVDAVEGIICWGLENGYVFRPLTVDSPAYHHTVKN